MPYIDIYSLRNLSTDPNQENFYDLFVQSYGILSQNIQPQLYLVDRSREMRLDLVCIDLYGDIANLQMLMKINNIDNPFGVKEGDLILWVLPQQLSNMEKIDPKIIQDNRDALIAAFKVSATDPARAAYLGSRGIDILPATIVATDAPKIQIDNSKIIVGANLFTNPNDQLRDVPDLSDSSLGQSFTGVQSPTLTKEEQDGDDTTRVLVRRFIRSGNGTVENQ